MTAGSILAPQVIPLRIPTAGKAKHEIDTNTFIEIKSDTPDVALCYTIDGHKPEPFRRVGYRDCNTFKYKGPILLPAGKITVKALAVTKDCRESAVVTKVFVVDLVSPHTHTPDGNNDKTLQRDPSMQEKENGLCDLRLEKKEVNGKSKPDWNGVAQECQGVPKEKGFMPSPSVGQHLLNLNTSCDKEESSPATLRPESQFPSSAVSNRSLTSTQALKTQRGRDFLKCAQCFAPRSLDPFARFCEECGSLIPPVPGFSLSPPGEAQMGLCVECQTMVPLNTPTCIVCEAVMAPQSQPPASNYLKGKVVCPVCGSGNPVHVKLCMICENQLPEVQTLRPPPLYFTCFKCNAKNCIWAQFCGTCGVPLEPLYRQGCEDNLLWVAGDGFVVSEKNSLQNWQHSIVPVSTSKSDPLMRKEQGTQTVGLFYPSGKFLEKREHELASQKEERRQMSHRKTLFTSISPGRGYWRKQLDHVCEHLRSYAQNNMEFRTLIGEPQMGKLTSATIHEDGHQVSLRLNYALAINKEILTYTPTTFDYRGPSSSKGGTNGLYGRKATLPNEESQSILSPRKKIHRMAKTWECLDQEDKLCSKSRQLLKEVGPNGKGRPFLVEQLIDEGADPNCDSDENRPALTWAVLNKHHEAVPVLVQKGAAIDHPSGPLNNTALHEAILLGLEGLNCTEALLGCNANIKAKNTRGLSAYDLALKSNSDKIVSLFASKLGQGILDNTTTTKQSPTNY
ncbi:double zinc ribbon and ankyrin repeat-containing protein 1 isoform X2 [Eublepharis macularius]|uniref:Double zinc ribbon and ankyrin repeat-containing protein 1 isoform X2 n=1 Tax=Eublepharis macularius TaxID=481883 RepID=A0AA97JRN4_EUBMA|nr:double zinc ribbon and ankyrin repeat-containing protein 1 isoform X2 [Eublepharis macularius]